ncbi:MAG: hypothetical protein RLY14_2524, partial [Planctomycetota bacterium]
FDSAKRFKDRATFGVFGAGCFRRMNDNLFGGLRNLNFLATFWAWPLLTSELLTDFESREATGAGNSNFHGEFIGKCRVGRSSLNQYYAGLGLVPVESRCYCHSTRSLLDLRGCESLIEKSKWMQRYDLQLPNPRTL